MCTFSHGLFCSVACFSTQLMYVCEKLNAIVPAASNLLSACPSTVVSGGFSSYAETSHADRSKQPCVTGDLGRGGGGHGQSTLFAYSRTATLNFFGRASPSPTACTACWCTRNPPPAEQVLTLSLPEHNKEIALHNVGDVLHFSFLFIWTETKAVPWIVQRIYCWTPSVAAFKCPC